MTPDVRYPDQSATQPDSETPSTCLPGTRLIRGAALLLLVAFLAPAAEFHISPKGSDRNSGTSSSPFKTISAAAAVAQPGDVITVHEGIYRERVTPPRGGTSESKRIVYQAAAGEKVTITGAEVIRGWKLIQPGVWKVTIPNTYFGSYNPYKDLIVGDWFTGKGRPHHTGEVYLNGKSLWETHLLERVLSPQVFPDGRDQEGSTWTWFTESDDVNTSLYANFHDRNPNEELVEINVRDSCFYPAQPGRDYITVRGFHLKQAATQWAAPTAEQIGLIGTHWSKGWIIENNVISDSKCSCVTLGKDRKTGHNVWMNDPSRDGAIHYNEVIVRALAIGWSREKIGSHVVRNNTIFNCEQAGIAGSLGAIYSQILNNHIYNVWAKRQFTGAEMGGIKLHAAIDVVIKGNRIHNAGRGLWLDWMAQGTRVTGNLFYDNTTDDIFVEVDHGPFVIDNNVLLSEVSLRDWSEGGAYAHNLMAGRVSSSPELSRSTPYHRAHSTALAGLRNIKGGDDRFYNNIFIGGAQPAQAESRSPAAARRFDGYGLWVYDTREANLQAGGNVYYNGAKPYGLEAAPTVDAGNPKPVIVEQGGHGYLVLHLGPEVAQAGTQRVTTALLGKARIPNLAFEKADGSELLLSTDFAGKRRSDSTPTPGPFETPGQGEVKIRIW
ncbi:right-handed parallel beta-helix repeat-containing protein [Paludibaculum fermentans]|uniref:Right-handed parallel beta-helix repeat-containing protein n=1 Tax=Paludibaculum fermentans TaxID=1473598 RepID=A0A7S7NR78_PALFE|nr:right-handed parallel beta-helix repeat-containing protein [Paludibaculum fermentans]QOY88336.1 right-handed parallel beta-helix repeat-containing protein [Paludibaculum fermentans]